MDKFDKHRGGDRYTNSSEDPCHYNSSDRYPRGGGDAPVYPYHQENYRGVRGGRAGSTCHGGSSNSGGGDGREDYRPFDGPPRRPILHSGGDGGFGGVRPMVDSGGGRGGFQSMGDTGGGFRPAGGVGGHFGSVGGGGEKERLLPVSGGGGDSERFQSMGGSERFPPMAGSKRFQPMDGGGSDSRMFQPMGGGGEMFQPISGGGEMFNTLGVGGGGGGGNGEKFKQTGGGGDRERFRSMGAGGVDGERFRSMGAGGVDGERFQPMADGGDAERFSSSSGVGEIFRSAGRNHGGGFRVNKNSIATLTSLTGQKRGYSFYGREKSPDRSDGGSFIKLFVGSVPRTATEADIQPLFDKYGHVMEVALIRDKRTGQQQGCCFIKFASSEEADRAIRALHNQYTLPGGVGPIQVRYADGERERLGATEHKLFVGSLNKQATEKEVEEIFLPYGRVEDVYLMRDEMKQSRGCGFVKYSQREMAQAAINALNGTYTMRGCDQPLNVRFADPKRPRPGESRGGPSFAGMGFGPQFSVPGIRPASDLGEPLHGHIPSNSWPPVSNTGPPATVGIHGFAKQLPARTVDMDVSSAPGPIGGFPRNIDCSIPGPRVTSAPLSQLKPPNIAAASTNTRNLQGSNIQLGPTQIPHPAGQTLTSQAPPSRQLPGFDGQFPFTQPQVQHHASLAPGQAPGSANQQQPAQQLNPHSQSPSQLAQMLSQQKQTLQATFQSSQQAFNQLQQQVQQLQPSTPNLTAHQGPQATKQQPPWAAIASQPISSTPNVHSAVDVASTTSASFSVPAVAAVNCNWTEHTSPDGYKYYYNGLTGESKWEKPEELIQYEQSLQHHKPYSQHSQVQLHPQGSSIQQGPQRQVQPHGQHLSQYQDPGLSSKQSSKDHGYAQIPGGTDPVNAPALYQQHIQASQDWIWKNKPSGT